MSEQFCGAFLMWRSIASDGISGADGVHPVVLVVHAGTRQAHASPGAWPRQTCSTNPFLTSRSWVCVSC
eukprot:2811341-Rhodomonas_salina.1